MRRIVLLVIMAFLIAGGTVGILHQEGYGGIANRTTESTLPTTVQETPEVTEPVPVVEEEPEVTEEPVVTEEEPAEEVVEEEPVEEVTEEETETEAEPAEEEVTEEVTEEAPASTTSSVDKASKAPFYKLTVNSNAGRLNIYDDPTQKSVIDMVSAGMTGYLIDENGTGRRRLVYIDGKICYITKLYTTITEIPMEEYPDELLNYSAADAGTSVTLGN